MACENAKKSTVEVTSNGRKYTFKFGVAPIYISCKNVQSTQCKKVTVYYSYEEKLSTGISTINQATFAYAPIIAIKNDAFNINLKCLGVRSDIACNANSSPSWQFIYGGSGGTFVIGSARITSIVENLPNAATAEKAKGILIVDKFNNVLLDDNSLECNWKITCDDDCPPGTCKCPSDNYPGYCCNDCSETAAKIQAITNTLRTFNNG